MEPLVDILMATCNGQNFVEEQIKSIQQQTCSNWRLLVSDDCSSDRTLKIVNDLASLDSRICVVSIGEEHGGAKENFFELMKHSDAPYFMFCDQDDVWLSQKIEKELDAISAEEKERCASLPVAVYTDMQIVDESLKELSSSFLDAEKKRSLNGNLECFLGISGAAGCTILGNEALRNLIVKSDCSFALMHDWWVCIVAASCGKLIYLDEQTVLYRQHSNNQIGASPYLFFNKLLGFSESRRKYWQTCNQAKHILQEYGENMHPNAREVVDVYASQLSQSPITSIKKMDECSLIKKGKGRKIGQILTLLLGAPSELKKVRNKRHSSSQLQVI